MAEIDEQVAGRGPGDVAAQKAGGQRDREHQHRDVHHDARRAYVASVVESGMCRQGDQTVPTSVAYGAASTRRRAGPARRHFAASVAAMATLTAANNPTAAASRAWKTSGYPPT